MIIMVLLAAAASIMYISLDILHIGQSTAVNEETRIEAEALASDILELTKYQIFYESIFYTDALGPWNNTGTRAQDIIALLGAGLGAASEEEADMLKACGGFDAKGKQIGVFNIRGVPVYCPFYLRSNLLSGLMLDQMVLQPLAAGGVLKQDKPGQFVLEIVYFDKSKGINVLTGNTGKYLALDAGQNIIRLANIRLERVVGRVRIMSTDSGFTASTSERFLEISSEVQLAGGAKLINVKRKQPLLTYPSTPRDFSLFLVYPTQSDGVTPTKLWSKSVVISPDSTVEGRVFFNGDIDVPISSLPVFTDTVVLTGDFKPALTKEQRASLPAKFLKGVITNYSAPRYLMSGQCSATNPSISIANGSGFNCKSSTGTTATITDYLNRIGGACINPPATYAAGAMTVNCTGQDAQCTVSCQAAIPPVIVSGPRRQVNLTGTYAVISAPVDLLTSSAENIYGTILGGHFKSLNKVHIYSMAAVKVGLPGIGSADTLANFTSLFQQAGTGVSVPLTNLPIVYEEGVSK
jgi:hypothetical protein